jgi:hypothetical protein
MKLYNKDFDFQKIIRLIWSLAYVPHDMVTTVWEIYIQEKVSETASNRKTSIGHR